VSKLALIFIFTLSTQSISEEWINKTPSRKHKVKDVATAQKNKRRLVKAPFLKIYGKNKIYK